MSEKFISYDNLKQYDEFLDKELNNIKDIVDNGFIFNVKYAESDEIGGAAIKAISDETGENIAEHFDNIENDITINKTTLGYQQKNLIKKLTQGSKTENGITFTVNSDNSITINGTATAYADFYIYGGWGSTTPVLSKPQTYTISLGSEFANSGMKGFIITNGTRAMREFTTVETEWTVTDDVANTHITSFMIRVPQGVTVDNLTVYPMIRYSFITDNTYEPYISDVDTRITENKSDIIINKTTLGYQKKNLFNLTNPVGSTTMGGITFTVNADKTITLNGTATTTPWFELKGNLNIQDKNLGGCKYSTGLTQNADSGCYVNISYYDTNWSHQANRIVSNNDVVLNGNYTYATHSIVVTKGTTLNNVIVKPMVRLPDITDTTFEPYIESVDERLQNFVKSGNGAKSGLVPAPPTTAGTTKYLREDGTWTIPPDTNIDTKNTAGSTDSSSKLFLIGATSQATNPQTYSHDTVYVGTDGCLYSNNTKVLTTAGGTIEGSITTTEANISSSSFGSLSVVRSGSTNAASIIFSNGNGVLGSIGMTGSVDSGLSRWSSDTNTKYTILDTGTAFTTTAPKANGTAATGTATTVSRSDHVHPLQTTVSGNAGTATKLATARTIDGVSFNGSANITHYGTCSTAAGTKAKDVVLSGFSLVTGARINVNFSNTNSADNITLNVNGTGAIPVFYVNSQMTARTLKLQGKHVYGFVYDGTNWIYEGDSSYSSQNATTTNVDYRVLLSHTDDDITERGVARKSSKFTANPSTGVMSASSFKSSGNNLLASGSITFGKDITTSINVTVENLSRYSTLYLNIRRAAQDFVISGIIPVSYLLADTTNKIEILGSIKGYPYGVLIKASGNTLIIQSPNDQMSQQSVAETSTYYIYKI